MDRELLPLRLADAGRRVDAGASILARQRSLMIKMRPEAHDTTLADDILATCQQTQALHIAHRERLRELLSQQPPEPEPGRSRIVRRSEFNIRRIIMSDDKANRGSPDNKRIDVNDPNEIRHWTQSLGVTEKQLKDAVARVGTSAEKVRESLRK